MSSSEPHPNLSKRAKGAQSSVIRELLQHAKQPGVISLAGGIPDPDLFPVGEISHAAQQALAEDAGVLQYGLTNGELGTREAASVLMGFDVDPRRVLVTTGSQQGLDLVTKVLVDVGDTVVVGDPSYLGALQAFRSHGAALDPLPVDEAGVDVDVLETRLEAGGSVPKFVYVVANFQNPTGAVLSAPRRRQLIRLAERYGFLIVEDDPYGQLRYDGTAVEPIGLGSDQVVRMRSTSKVLAPGLRVGWTEGPAWLIDAMSVAKQSADLHTSTLSQAVVTRLLMRTDWFETHLATLVGQYRARRDALCSALEATFGTQAQYQRPEGGMFIWARFPGHDMTAQLPQALEGGVAYVPASAFMVSGDRDDWARLSFATQDPEDFLTAAERLAAALQLPGCSIA